MTVSRRKTGTEFGLHGPAANLFIISGLQDNRVSVGLWCDYHLRELDPLLHRRKSIRMLRLSSVVMSLTQTSYRGSPKDFGGGRRNRWRRHGCPFKRHRAYLDAVEGAFGMDVDYAQLQKIYGASMEPEKRHKYETFSRFPRLNI